jgi:hypothetical protein
MSTGAAERKGQNTSSNLTAVPNYIENPHQKKHNTTILLNKLKL